MSGGNLHAAYEKLDATARHVIQICALSQSPLNRKYIAALSSKSGWKDRNGKGLTQTAAGQIIEKLTRQDLLVRSSYSYVAANQAVEDLAVQDSIRQNWFDKLRNAIAERSASRSYYSYRPSRLACDLRIAFYTGQVSQFQSLVKRANRESPVRLCDPFSRDIFDRLDPILQEMYLLDTVPQVILDPAHGDDILAAFDELAGTQAALGDELAGCWLDLAVARGDFESLRKLDECTGHKLREVEGCEALLRGDWERAERCLAEALPGASQKGKRKSRIAAAHLPALLYLLLLFKRASAESLARALSLISSSAKGGTNKYAAAMEAVTASIAFRQSPSSPAPFASRLKELCKSPLATLIVGYFYRWLLTEDDATQQVSNLVPIAAAYRAAGLSWLAAEAAGLAGRSTLKSAAAQADKQQELHARLGTTSLVNLIQPEPVWQRSLNAIAQLGEDRPAAAAAVEPAAESERVIWELNAAHEAISLQPFVQKRTAGGWTTGRRVGLQRLYFECNSPEFAFLTDQDRALCRALKSWSERNYRGYTESFFEFDDALAARALVGHPCVFREGDRDTPLEIVEQPPRLVVAKQGDHILRLKLDPEPKKDYTGAEQPHRLLQDGPRRIVLVFFNEQHLKLHKILGKMLDVPAAAAERVVASIQKVSSLVAVHSEIGGDLPAAESVAGDARPHIHLLPFQGGLRAEFFVRPFGDDGPFCRPSQGGANVFANLGGQPKTARRDLPEEQRQLESLLAACPALGTQTEGEAACFPSPVERSKRCCNWRIKWPRTASCCTGRRARVCGWRDARRLRNSKCTFARTAIGSRLRAR